MKIENIHLETIASASDFYEYINANKEELGFDSEEFHDHFLDNMFSEGNL